MLFLVQRDQDLAVGAGDGRDVALRDGRPAVRDADVVDQHVDLVGRNDVADLAFDRGEARLGLLDARAGGTARMQPHLAGIDGGEEILADQPRPARATPTEKPMKRGEHRPAMPQRPVAAGRCSGTRSASNAALKSWWTRQNRPLPPARVLAFLAYSSDFRPSR